MRAPDDKRNANTTEARPKTKASALRAALTAATGRTLHPLPLHIAPAALTADAAISWRLRTRPDHLPARRTSPPPSDPQPSKASRPPP